MHDLTIISFDSIPACDGRTDTSPMPENRSIVRSYAAYTLEREAEREKMYRALFCDS